MVSACICLARGSFEKGIDKRVEARAKVLENHDAVSNVASQQGSAVTMTGNATGKESAGYSFLCQARGLKHVRGRGIVSRRTCRFLDDGPDTAVGVARNGSHDEVALTVVAQNLRVVEFDKIARRLGERFPGLGQDFLHINGAQLAHRICYSILPRQDLSSSAPVEAICAIPGQCHKESRRARETRGPRPSCRTSTSLMTRGAGRYG